MVGAGANLVSGGSALIIPAGLSLGRRIDPRDPPSASCVRAATFAFIVGDFPSDLVFGFGVGADFPAVPRCSTRACAGGLGDRRSPACRIGAVWVH